MPIRVSGSLLGLRLCWAQLPRSASQQGGSAALLAGSSLVGAESHMCCSLPAENAVGASLDSGPLTCKAEILPAGSSRVE